MKSAAIDTLLIFLCMFSLSVVPWTKARNVQKNANKKEEWLVDKIDYDYMSDSPSGPSGSAELCPPVPKVLPPGSCDVKVCYSDRECHHQSNKCCYNGCTYTCLFSVRPAPHYDWVKEPKSLFISGRSWLVNGPNNVNEMNPCSTSPVSDDEDPLLCPTGYVCNIEDHGDPKKGIPNRGYCVKEVDDVIPQIEFEEDIQATEEDERTEHSRHCPVKDSDLIVLNTGTITLDGKLCKCNEGTFDCETL